MNTISSQRAIRADQSVVDWYRFLRAGGKLGFSEFRRIRNSPTQIAAAISARRYQSEVLESESSPDQIMRQGPRQNSIAAAAPQSAVESALATSGFWRTVLSLFQQRHSARKSNLHSVPPAALSARAISIWARVLRIFAPHQKAGATNQAKGSSADSKTNAGGKQ